MRAVAPRRTGLLRIETCAGSWLVDARQMRWCRVDRGTPVTFVPPRAWQRFHSLLIAKGGVVRLLLDERGESAISGWLHGDGCSRCAQAARKLA